MWGTKLYKTWADMIQRCENPNSTNYKHYGMRGIAVTEDWKTFINFFEWAIKNGYKDGLSIDRIDVNGNYEPNNCRWVTREKQNNNRTDTIWVEINGEKMSLKEVSRKYNLSYGMLKHRYHVGDRGEKLIEKPNRGVKRNGKQNNPDFLKLDKDIVGEIKWLLRNTDMIQTEIANKYSVSQTMVSKIKLGRQHSSVNEKKPNWFKEKEYHDM